MLYYLVLAGLFYALTPGVLLTLPKKSSKNTVALTHAVVYAGAYYVAERFFGLKEGFQSGSGLMEVPVGADPATVYKIQAHNSFIISQQMATEASTNGTSTPLYLSLTAIKDQYDAAARAAQYAATAEANESGSGPGKVAIAAPLIATAAPEVGSGAGSGPIPGVVTPRISTGRTPGARPSPRPQRNTGFDPTSPGAIVLWVFLGILLAIAIYYASNSR